MTYRETLKWLSENWNGEFGEKCNVEWYNVGGWTEMSCLDYIEDVIAAPLRLTRAEVERRTGRKVIEWREPRKGEDYWLNHSGGITRTLTCLGSHWILGDKLDAPEVKGTCGDCVNFVSRMNEEDAREEYYEAMRQEYEHAIQQAEQYMSELLGTDAVRSIMEERVRQNDKWGEQNHAPEWWLAILMEEVGELAQAILETHFDANPEHLTKGGINNIRKEAVQCAAVAQALIECIDRNAKEAPDARDNS